MKQPTKAALRDWIRYLESKAKRRESYAWTCNVELRAELDECRRTIETLQTRLKGKKINECEVDKHFLQWLSPKGVRELKTVDITFWQCDRCGKQIEIAEGRHPVASPEHLNA